MTIIPKAHHVTYRTPSPWLRVENDALQACKVGRYGTVTLTKALYGANGGRRNRELTVELHGDGGQTYSTYEKTEYYDTVS